MIGKPRLAAPLYRDVSWLMPNALAAANDDGLASKRRPPFREFVPDFVTMSRESATR